MQVDFGALLSAARDAGTSVPCVPVATLADAEAVLAGFGAVVLQLAYADTSGFRALAAGCEALAAESASSVAIVAIGAADEAAAAKAVNAGCHGLLTDAESEDACEGVAAGCGVTVCDAADPMLGGAGQAKPILQGLSPWVPVDHVIVYNVQGIDADGVDKLMAEGRKALSAIAGVRWIYTGESVTEGSKFQFSWLVRFVHADVIASYRDHPAHVAYADNWFRPVAGDRITIDFRVVS